MAKNKSQENRNMKILQIPDTILNTKAEEITDFSGMANLADQMLDTLRENSLHGLAGNQVGILKRIFVLEIPKFDSLPTAFINPVIKGDKTGGRKFDWEGCASIPNMGCLVERWNTITITAQDVNGQKFELTVKGYQARVMQHETDHLSGILMSSKARERRITK